LTLIKLSVKFRQKRKYVTSVSFKRHKGAGSAISYSRFSARPTSRTKHTKQKLHTKFGEHVDIVQLKFN